MKHDLDKLAKEWINLFADLSEIWLNKDLVTSFADHIKKYLKESSVHYYDIDEFGMDKTLIEALRPISQFLFHNYWRVKVVGINHIPLKKRALIVSNHSGAIPLDGTMINTAVYNRHPKSRNVRFLVDDFVYHAPFLGTMMTRLGGVRACPENAERLLSKNNLVTVFPEGIKGVAKNYNDRYKLLRFGRGGYVKMAIQTKSQIIPTAVIGAEEIYPVIGKSAVLGKMLGLPYLPISPFFPFLGPLGMIPLPSKWTIQFGKPIDCSKYKQSDADKDILIHQINKKIRNEVKKMIASGLKDRESAWK